MSGPRGGRTRNSFATCVDCGDVRFMKRLNASGLRRCRSCAGKKMAKEATLSMSERARRGGRKVVELGKLKLATAKAHTPEAERRRFETLKRSGKLWSSKPEKRLHELLVEQFGSFDVEHHVVVDGFRIDFHVGSIDTYVQLDGEYWHGLDRPYDELSGAPREKFDRDRRCDEHFRESCMRLIRITDKELADNEQSAIRRVER